MKKIGLLVLIMVFVFAIPSAKAVPPDISTITKKVMDAINNSQQGSRKVVILIKDGDEETTKWSARNAIKEFEDGKHSLLVILEPESLKGQAYQFWQPKNGPLKQWMYSPLTRRVRPIKGQMAYGSFLGTDFTLTDFGMSDPSGNHSFLAEEKYLGKESYKIETVPAEKWLYSKIITWIAVDTFLPMKRAYYDSSGTLWKTKLYENVAMLNNIPIPLKIRMLDVHEKTSTELIISDVCFDVDYIPRDAFNIEKLPKASLSPVCAVPPPPKED